MFTGLVETMGEVRALVADGLGSRLTIVEPSLAPRLKLGDSVAVNGVCLTVVERDAAVVLIDPASVPFLAGSEVDFVDDLIGASFRVNNPNATASCGCGTSFSI